MKSRSMTIALIGIGVLGASALGVSQAPAYGGNQAPGYDAAQPQAAPANPGAVNYVEGTVLLDGNSLSRQEIGRAHV